MFELVYHLAQVPTWYGWVMMTGGISALSFLAGLRAGRR